MGADREIGCNEQGEKELGKWNREFELFPSRLTSFVFYPVCHYLPSPSHAFILLHAFLYRASPSGTVWNLPG